MGWLIKTIRKSVAKILKEEYFIAADMGPQDTEIIVAKYSYKTGRIEIIGDHILRRTPLIDAEQQIRKLAREFNGTIIRDYPADAKDFINGIRY